MAATGKASEIRAARKQLRAVTSVRRSVFYFMRTILTVLAVGALCILAFLSAARMSTTYILVNEGMSQRAECILKNASENDLASFFTVSCIESDANQRETSAAPYGNVTVSSYEYSLRILNMHLLPWHINTYVDVVEQVHGIKGSVSAESGSDASIPDWSPRKYRLHISRTDGRWFIESVELLELNPKLDPPATPDPDASPLPIVTPSPVPTPVPSPTPDEVIFQPND
jgi:hypothetical protein